MCPAYTTDLNAAWQAADHFAERYGCTIRVERHTKMRYVATVQGGNIAYDRADCALGVGSNEGPAHALCQVMLQARVLTEEEMFV